MQIYSSTGKLKTDELRVTRPIGALVVATNQPLAEIENEKISIFIESANGDNKRIAQNIALRAFMRSSVFGSAAVQLTNDGVSALCEVAQEGAIVLEEGESLKVSLSDLKSAKTYSINAVEYPSSSSTLIQFDRKVLLTEEQSRKFEVSGYDSVCLTGADKIHEMSVSYANGQTVKFTQEEVKALAFDVDPVQAVGNSGTISELANEVIFPLVGAVSIDLEKTDGNIVLTFLGTGTY